MKLLAAVAAGFIIGFLVGNAQPKFDINVFSTAPTPAPAPYVAPPTPPGAWMFDKGRTQLDKGAYGAHGYMFTPIPMGPPH